MNHSNKQQKKKDQDCYKEKEKEKEEQNENENYKMRDKHNHKQKYNSSSSHEKHYPNFNPDYIIIGLGTSAAALIYELIAADPCIKIVVLEAGQKPNSISFQQKEKQDKEESLKQKECNHKLTTNTSATGLNQNNETVTLLSNYERFLGNSYPTTARIGWGGSGVLYHNNIWSLNSPEHWDKWENAGAGQDWSYDTLVPLLKKLESFKPNGTTLSESEVDRRVRSKQGIVPIQQLPQSSGVSVYLTQIIANLSGVDVVTDYNAAIANGVDPAIQVWSHTNNNNSILTSNCSSSSSSCSSSFSSSSSYTAIPTDAPTYHNPIATWLKDNMNENGIGQQVQVISDAVVIKLIFKEHCSSNSSSSNSSSSSKKSDNMRPRAIGVEFMYTRTGTSDTVQKLFGKTIILCAGVLGSSAILERSGIHDQIKIGQTLNIPTLVNNPNVGENLCNTIGPMMIIRRVDQLNTNRAWNKGEQGPVAFLPFVHPTQQLVSEPDLRRWQLISHAGLSDLPLQFPQFTSIYNLTPPSYLNVTPPPVDQNSDLLQMSMIDLTLTSRGSIHITSRNFCVGTPSTLKFNYFDTLRDLQTALAAYQFMFRILKQLQTEHPQEHFQLVYPPSESLFTDTVNQGAGLIPFLNSSISTDAYCGQNRISSTIKRGVVNGRLRVHGVEALYIADLSICPVPCESNSISTAMLIGMNLARMLTDKKRKNRKQEKNKNKNKNEEDYVMNDYSSSESENESKHQKKKRYHKSKAK